MKASEIIKAFQQEIEKRGDLEVVFYGAYGAESEEFFVATEKEVDKDDLKDKIWIYTGVNTG